MIYSTNCSTTEPLHTFLWAEAFFASWPHLVSQLFVFGNRWHIKTLIRSAVRCALCFLLDPLSSRFRYCSYYKLLFNCRPCTHSLLCEAPQKLNCLLNRNFCCGVEMVERSSRYYPYPLTARCAAFQVGDVTMFVNKVFSNHRINCNYNKQNTTISVFEDLETAVIVAVSIRTSTSAADLSNLIEEAESVTFNSTIHSFIVTRPASLQIAISGIGWHSALLASQ